MDGMALLLIMEVKNNFSLGFDNTYHQTNKLWNINALQCTIVVYSVPQGTELSQLEGSKGGGPHRKVKWWLMSMLMKWSGIDVLNIKQRDGIQGLYFS